MVSKYIFVTYLIWLLLFNILQAQTIISGGFVSGIWNSTGSPYIVQDHVLVHADSELIIHEGVAVLFSGSYFLEVHGQLLVTGTPEQPVTFDRENEAVAWRGIFFNNTDTSITDSSILQYGVISHCSNSCVTVHWSSRLRISNFTISRGNAFRGGGINCRYSDPIFEELTIMENESLDGAGISLEQSDAVIKDCIIMQNDASGAGGGLAIFDPCSPYLENCQVRFNSSFGSGGGIYINEAFPAFINCDISNNQGAIGGGTAYSGGGVSVKLNAVTEFENCAFQNNSSGSSGGAIASFSPNRIINCLFTQNQADSHGGAIYLGAGNVIESRVFNCTFAENMASQGSAVSCYNHVALLRNSILWDKWNLNPTSLLYLGSITALETADISYCDVQNGKTSIELWQNASYHWGQNNLDEDPQLDSSDYSLTWASPCIEAGTPDTSGLGLPLADLAGNPRIANLVVDIGAFEYQAMVEIMAPENRKPACLKIYPNPAGMTVYVETGTFPEGGVLQILNAYGEIVGEHEISSGRIILNTGKNPPGMYYLRLMDENNTVVEKLLIY